MSANYLLNKLYFEKASSFEVVNLQKPQKALTDKEFCDLSYAGSQREIHFTFKFNQPVVVQRLEIQMCKAKTRSFSLSKVEGNLLGDLIDYETFSGTQKLTNVMNDVNFNQETYDSKGVGEMIRVCFTCLANTSLTVNSSSEDTYRAFLKEYSTISFFGLMSERNMKPQISRDLLNISLYFRNENLYLSANEVEIILSLALINEGKVIQAREILTKSINFLEYCTNGIIEHLMRLKNHDFSFTSVQKILRQITKIRFRCCLLELLKSTLFKTSDCVDQRILSLATSATLYCKSKKQDKSFPMNDDYRILFAAVYDTILLICEDILTGDYPDHYRLAAIESLFFGLKHQQSISKDQLVNSLRLVTCFSIVLADKDMCTWNSEKCDNSNMSYELLKKSIEGVISENELANKVLKDNLIEVDGDDDPYLNTKPMIHNAVYMYLTNLASLLPCLSAYILHRILEIVVTNNALFIFTMPTKISLTLIKIVEKIIVICQADVRVPIHFFGNFLTFLTVLNNSSYREKIEKAFADCSELQPTSKEVFAVYLQLAKADVAEELGQAYSTLWETLKTKYIFLVGMSDIKKFMSQISRRLQDLSRELESQVFTTEFDTFEVRSKSNESSGLNELKFEKLKSKQEPVLMSTKDLTKSKLEYLKNFRDIFGELEYYLELIDCITANLKEKVLIFNHVPEPLKDGEANLDQVSKKLISNFSSSGMQILNSMDAKFWETSNDMALKVQHFLKTFLRDSVFIDYFQSTWVILCSFLSIREPVRNEKINSLLYVVLREIEERPGAQQSLVHSHTLKSLHYLLEYTSKFVHVHYDDKINDLLVRVLSKLLIQVRHTQNSELVRLIRFLISKFPDVITDESIPDLFTFFLEPYFDLESENAIKLVDQLLDICSKKQEKDDIFASLIQILVCSGSTAAAQKDNMDRRMQILAKRHKKAKHILTTKVSQQQVIDDSMKKLKILHKVLERADSKLLVELVRLSYLEASSSGKSRGMSDLHSDNGNLILGFLLSCVQLQDPNLDLLTIGICVMLLQRIKPSSSYPSKSSVTICDFVLRNIKTLCNRPFLEAQSQHELLVCCLLIFSEHLPPAPFEVEP